MTDLLKGGIQNINLLTETDTSDETTTFTHTCLHCSHVIAEHYYSFSVIDGIQNFLMDCVLCGRGQNSSQIHFAKFSSSPDLEQVNVGKSIEYTQQNKIVENECREIKSSNGIEDHRFSDTEKELPTLNEIIESAFERFQRCLDEARRNGAIEEDETNDANSDEDEWVDWVT